MFGIQFELHRIKRFQHLSQISQTRQGLNSLQTHEQVEQAAMQRVCFNPLKHWQLQRTRKRCSGVYLLIVWEQTHTHRVFLATSPQGYIMAFYVVMEK